MFPLIVTAALLRKNSKILITKRPADKPHGGFWEFPGGKLQRNETPQQALQRELREELDLDVEVGSIFEVVYHRYEWGPVLILVYQCQPRSEVIRNLEVADHAWAAVDELSGYDVLPADRPVIDKLLRQECSVVSLPPSTAD